MNNAAAAVLPFSVAALCILDGAYHKVDLRGRKSGIDPLAISQLS